MYRYVGHVVSAIEKSDLDQVLSRKLPSSMRSIRCGVCSMCTTLLVTPDSAGGDLRRVRVVSRRRVLLSFFGQNYCSDPSYLFVRIDTYQSNLCHERNRLVQQGLSLMSISGWLFDPQSDLFFLV